MSTYLSWLREHLHQVYERNPFVALLDMRVTDLGNGEATVTMPVIAKKHTNLYGFVHGGALASLADTAMGVACATTGNRVVTVDMHSNFIKNVQEGNCVTALSKVIHHGNSTMVAETEIRSEEQQLLFKALGTFFVIGHFDESDCI